MRIAASLLLLTVIIPTAPTPTIALPEDPFVNPYSELHICTQPDATPSVVILNCALVLKNGLGALGQNDQNVVRAVALLHLGTAYVRQGQRDEAVKDFGLSLAFIRLRLQKVPEDYWALGFRCFARGVAGIELDEALADCDAALRTKPDDASLLDSRAFVLYRQGKLNDAVDGYTAALTANPDYASSLFMRGIVRLQLGDASQADADIKAAQSHQSNITTLYEGYGIRLD